MLAYLHFLIEFIVVHSVRTKELFLPSFSKFDFDELSGFPWLVQRSLRCFASLLFY